MALTYQTFLKKGINLAPLGWETEGAFIPYFCTPRGAKVLGWAGVDGIHYCTIRGFGEMIFHPRFWGDDFCSQPYEYRRLCPSHCPEF